MAKQAELEKQLCLSSATFFSCRRSRSATTDSNSNSNSYTNSDEDNDSYESSQNSPSTSMNWSSDDVLAASRVSSIDTDTDSSLVCVPVVGLGDGTETRETENERHRERERERKTRDDIQAAMCDSILPLEGGRRGEESRSLPAVSSGSSLRRLTASPRTLKEARSLTELDRLATSMLISISKDESMDVDDIDNGVETSDPSSSVAVDKSSLRHLSPSPIHQDGSSTPTRPIRAQSCGAKRPLVTPDEEDKRRKVDEAMVVEEAVETGVIQPKTNKSTSPSTTLKSSGLSASTPNLSQVSSTTAPAASPAPTSGSEQVSANVFGHVVKTSSTHPIIISPFFPADLLPIISSHLVTPPPTGPFSATPLMLSSTVDVPSLLLSYVSPGGRGRNSPTGSISDISVISSRSTMTSSEYSTPLSSTSSLGTGFGRGDQHQRSKMVGNLLLSSCPGKRLRMEGPVKGRGPVCRDLKVDLARVKAEGVGCLVW